jgi:hypothetical protein
MIKNAHDLVAEAKAQIQKIPSAQAEDAVRDSDVLLGLISLDADHVDPHKKFITLSTNGLNYFKRIEDCLDMALMLQ